MRIRSPLRRGRLLRRYKRFLADVELEDGEVLTAHCPNPGSLAGCLEEGQEAIVRDSEDPRRKLRFTLQTLKVGRSWVNVDTMLPNPLVAEWVEAGLIPELTGFERIEREVRYGDSSRIDLLLTDANGGRTYVEVKNTTLVERGVARFPDSVTERGRKHLEELVRMVEEGHRAVMFFLVSRADARRFEPADAIDPAYGLMLREALARGVEALVYSARVRPERIELGRPLPLVLPDPPPEAPSSRTARRRTKAPRRARGNARRAR